MAGVRRANDVCQSLLRAQLGHRVNVLIIEKARQLDLSQFEDARTYDQMTQARRGASTRPLSLVRRTFGILRNGLSLISTERSCCPSPHRRGDSRPHGPAGLLCGDAIRRPRVPAVYLALARKRMQNYLEIVVSREDYAKEVKLLGLGPCWCNATTASSTMCLAKRLRSPQTGRLGLRHQLAVYTALYGTYAWIALSAMANAITLGQMTMYLMVFKQGQGAFSGVLRDLGGMYEDNLYLDNLYQFLETTVPAWPGTATEGSKPGDGIRFEAVSFTYPGASEPALDRVSLHIPPGRKLALVGHNGSGKTTLIKLLTGLYRPSSAPSASMAAPFRNGTATPCMRGWA